MKTSETTTRPPSAFGQYVLDNAAPETPARFSALAELYDGATIAHLEKLGVGRGWRCWEIGAGSGSIAQWLYRKVEPSGFVLATDIDTRFLKPGCGLGFRFARHDIVSAPLPDMQFDLIHTRLVLVHLPEREQVLNRMIEALNPGGWLLLEEFDSVSALSSPERFPMEVALKSALAFREIMLARGVDPGFGRALAGHLVNREMQNVSAEGRLLMFRGGSPGARLMRSNFEQLREDILAGGRVSATEFEDDLARLEREDFMMSSPVMWSVAGRRAAWREFR